LQEAPPLWLRTPRTFIVPTPVAALERSHAAADYYVEIPIEPRQGGAMIHFPPEWPGESRREWRTWADAWWATDRTPWLATVIDRDALQAIGQVGCPAPPTADGTIDVRYATNPSHRDRGIATEAGGAFVDWLLTQPDVARVIAECLVTNAASVRVLERVGFTLLEEREDPEGRLLRWERRRP
jgi:[ribosomal protein S5]-alanine N-acetyltransferase